MLSVQSVDAGIRNGGRDRNSSQKAAQAAEEDKMATDVVIKGQKAKKGERMTLGAGWRLATTKGKQRVFVGTLLKTFNFGNRRLAIFSVPK